MSTSIRAIVSLIRALSNDSDPEVRINTDSDIRAYITIVSASTSFTVTIVDQFTIKEDLTPVEVSLIACECSILIVGGQLKEFSYKTPVLSVKRVHAGVSDRLSGLWAILRKLEGPAVSWDDEINKILYDCDRYIKALQGGGDG